MNRGASPTPDLNLKALAIVKPKSVSKNINGPAGDALLSPSSPTATATATTPTIIATKRNSNAAAVTIPTIDMNNNASFKKKAAFQEERDDDRASAVASWTSWMEKQWNSPPFLARRFLLDIFCFAFALLASNYASNMAENLSPTYQNYAPLPDQTFTITPTIQYEYLTDVFAYSSAFLSAILLIYRISTDSFLPSIQYLECLCILYLMRCTTILVTNLPDPAGTATTCPSMPLSSVLTSFPSHRCGDEMFSGHTTLLVTSTLCYITHFPKHSKGLHIAASVLMVLVALGGVSMILLNRTHYTSGVVVAVYLCVGVWWSHKYLVGVKQLARFNVGVVYRKRGAMVSPV